MMWFAGQECIKIGIQVLKMFAFFQVFFVYKKERMEVCPFFNIYYQKMLEEEKEYLEMQDQYFRELYAKNKEESKLRHDWKNHIACVNALCEKSEFDEVKKYIKKLDENIQGLRENIDCGNPIVSVLVSQFSKKAQENQVEFQVHGHIGEEIHMDSMDICTLMSNMLNNALEACAQTEKDRWIQLDLQYSKKHLHICIRNTMRKKKYFPIKK